MPDSEGDEDRSGGVVRTGGGEKRGWEVSF